jgi:mannose-6-phosphate isomerase-like protein (cupin superfamily)
VDPGGLVGIGEGDRVTPGRLRHERGLPPRRVAGDTAQVRETLDAPPLRQEVIRFAPGRSRPREAAQETVLFVLAGRGTVVVAGTPHPVEPEAGVLVGAGEAWEVDHPGPEELAVVAVAVADGTGDGEGAARAEQPGAAAAGDGEAGAPRRVVVRLAEQEARAATSDRQFRIVHDPATGCRGATQFVGWIPPGRASTHYHHYDEVIYVLDGQGVLHLAAGEGGPIGPGACIHLPARLLHCLENTGTAPMRVLGVFRPAGDPSAAYLPGGGRAATPEEEDEAR